MNFDPLASSLNFLDPSLKRKNNQESSDHNKRIKHKEDEKLTLVLFQRKIPDDYPIFNRPPLGPPSTKNPLSSLRVDILSVERLQCLVYKRVESHFQNLGFSDDAILNKAKSLLDKYLFNIVSNHSNCVRLSKQQTTLPLTLYISMGMDHRSLVVQMYNPSKLIPRSNVGIGGYKEIKKAMSIKISLEQLEDVQTVASVVQRSLKYGSIAKIGEGYDSLMKIMQKIKDDGKDVNIAFASDKRVYWSNILGNYRIEFSMDWFNGDLETFIQKKKIPLHQNMPGQYYYRGIDEIINILIDCSNALSAVHKAGKNGLGYVHLDVRPGNILIKVVDNKVRGYIADFDITRRIGESFDGGRCNYYDECTQNGIVLPSSDVCGLLLVAGEAIIPSFWEFFNDSSLSNMEQLENLLLAEVENYSGISIEVKETILKNYEKMSKKYDGVNIEYQAFSNLIKAVNKYRDGNVGEIDQKELKKLSAELNVINEIFQMVNSQTKASLSLYQHFINYPDLKSTLKHSVAEDRNEILEGIYNRFSLLITADKLTARLEKIKAEFSCNIT